MHAFGEPRETYFADTPLALLAADARRQGHGVKSVRVYYDGRESERDTEIAGRLTAWLAEMDADLVVVERVFDPEPIRAHVAARPDRVALQVTRGDSLEPAPGIEWVLGAVTDPVPGGATRRSPSMAQLRHAFRAFMSAQASGASLADTPGVARVVDAALVPGAALSASAPVLPFDPVLDFEVIAPGEAPPIIAKTLLGNVGCPFAADPLDNPDYRALELPMSLPVARLGCAFCHMGGDYEKRPDAEVVAELVTQARYFCEGLPELEDLVLSDQHALRYLAELVEAAHQAGVRPMRWLFPARPDAFVRERERIARAAEVASRRGHVIELYLAGFEAFSDRELRRYNKGTGKAELVAAVGEMRRLELSHPEGFAFTRARAHSLVLWNPWTRPEDLRESVETMRAHDLDELFHEIGRNRLRLYRELPIYWAALRDDAVLAGWSESDQGSGRRKGYSSELPWRFLDPRTGVAYGLARELRAVLGGETELDQLAAAIDFAERGGDVSGVKPALARLESAFGALLVRVRHAGAPERSASQRAAGVRFLHTPHDEARRIQRARSAGQPLLLAGHEPSAHPDFLALVAAARGDEPRHVGMVSDARRFADASFARAAVVAGLSAASLRVSSDDPAALAGVHELRRLLTALELRVALKRETLAHAEDVVSLARKLDVRQLRIEVALDDVGLDALELAADALERVASRAAAGGVALEVAPLRAGTSDLRWMPAARAR